LKNFIVKFGIWDRKKRADSKIEGETANGKSTFRTRGLGIIASARLIVTGIAVIVLVFVANFFFDIKQAVTALFPTQSKLAVTMTLLENKDVMELVTDKLLIQHVISGSRGNPFVGYEKVFLIVQAQANYGIDLSALTESDLVTTADGIHVTLPRPRITDITIDPTSVDYMSKTTPLRSFTRSALNEQGMMSYLLDKVPTKVKMYMNDNDLTPSDEEVLANVNSLINVMEPAGYNIEAIYRDQDSR
jgi:hypothetical protein